MGKNFKHKLNQMMLLEKIPTLVCILACFASVLMGFAVSYAIFGTSAYPTIYADAASPGEDSEAYQAGFGAGVGASGAGAGDAGVDGTSGTDVIGADAGSANTGGTHSSGTGSSTGGANMDGADIDGSDAIGSFYFVCEYTGVARADSGMVGGQALPPGANSTRATTDGSNAQYMYVVTVIDGYIVVFHSEVYGGGLKERTSTAVGALHPEELARLTSGIKVYSDEALARILQDYGS